MLEPKKCEIAIAFNLFAATLYTLLFCTRLRKYPMKFFIHIGLKLVDTDGHLIFYLPSYTINTNHLIQ